MRGLWTLGLGLAWVLGACSTPTDAPDPPPDVADTKREVAATPPPEPKAEIAAPRDRPPWPPPALERMPFVGESMEGEGQWRPVTPLVVQNSGAPPMMFQTTLRNRKLKGPKRDRFNKSLHYEIEIVVWEPGQVDLRLVAGLQEPEAPRGKRGTGMIPRNEATMGALIAAFNGGWRTKDTSTSGIMVDKNIGLPPGKGVSTLAMYNDGRVEMGTWEDPAREIPADMHSFRQNTHPLYGDGKYNPLGRKAKWGGTGGVAGADGAYTVRSGICRTKHGHMAFIYGQQMDHIQLAEAMALAACEYGIHLDMNGIHAAFEYLSLSGFEQGPRGLKWQKEAERLTKKMYYKPFPRYLDKRPKDFFYLLRKPALPHTWGDMKATALPQPGSARNLPAAVAAKHPEIDGLRVLAWSDRRFERATDAAAVDGGLQLLLRCTDKAGKGRLIRSAEGALAVVFDAPPEGSKTLCQGAAHSGPIPEGGFRLVGTDGRHMALLEAPKGAESALKTVLASVTGWTWMAVSADTALEVRTRAAKGDQWVSYDGFATQGTPIEPPTTASGDGLIFALPAERALVGPLFEETP